MRRILPLTIFCFCTLNQLIAQKISDHVVTKDSVYMQGVVHLIGKEKIQFQRSAISEPVTYSLDDIAQYGLGEKTYEALVINSKREFYIRYLEGKVSLYFKHGTYVMRSEDALTTFRRRKFRSVLSSVIKCDGDDPSLSKLSYTKAAIKGFVNSYNLGECDSDLIPHKKFGIMAGYNYITTNASTTGTTAFKKTEGAPFAGVFIDLPASQTKGIYASFEVTGTTYQPSFYNETASGTSFLTLKIKSVNTGGNVKFISMEGPVKPYFRFGVRASFVQVSSPTGLLTTERTGNTITFTKAIAFTPANTTLYGVSLGAGVEIPIHKRKTLHAEVRYSPGVGTQNTTDIDMSISTVGVIAGFSL